MTAHLLHVVGARPNFMKVAPVLSALADWPGCKQVLLHTGQHYDQSMSGVFFQQLGLPQPDINLGVGSGTQSVQTAQIMMRFEEVIVSRRPDAVLVYGDVNSTVAAALVCAKNQLPVAHVEAGLRSYDRSMPEEINRLLTDQIADVLFTPSQGASDNLKREGIPDSRIELVGNVMIDTLVRLLPAARLPADLPLEPRCVLVTLHRPSNVDDVEVLRRIIETLVDLSQDVQIVFPVHPRTRTRVSSFGLKLPSHERLLFLEPLGYLEFLALQRGATAVVTDSGGVQEETTYLGVPCLTLRENTERPVTIEQGTNLLLGNDMSALRQALHAILDGQGKRGTVPALWDGCAGRRVAQGLAQWWARRGSPLS